MYNKCIIALSYFSGTHPSHIFLSTKKPQRISTSLYIKQTSGTTISPTRHSVQPSDMNSVTLASSTHTGFYTMPGWQSTTEPGFITKVKTKPSSSNKYKPTKKPLIPSTGKNTLKPPTKQPIKTTALTTLR